MKEELKFVLSAEAQGAEEAKQKFTNAIQQVGQVYSKIQSTVQNTAKETQKTLGNIVSGVKAAATQMQNQYSNMSVERLSSEYVKLEERIIKQKAVVQQANQALEEYAAMWDRIAASGTQTAATADNDAQLAKLASAANQAAAELRELQAAQQQVSAAMVANTQYSQQMDVARQKTAQTKMGIDAMAFSIATVGRATGGTIGRIVSLAEEVRYLKQAFTSTASEAGKGMAVISSAVGGVGIALTAVMLVINAVTKAEEEARRKAEELREEIKSISADNQGAAKLVAEYETLSSKVVKTADDTQRMVDIRAELVESYGFAVAAVDEEGRLLAGNLELMKEQLKTAQELLLVKLKEDESSREEDYKKALKERTDDLRRLSEIREELSNPEYYARMWYNVPDSGVDQYVQELEREKELLTGKLGENFEAISDDAQTAIDSLFRIMVLEAQAQGKEVPEAIQTAVKTAWENAFLQGTDIEVAQAAAQNMLDTFFALDTSIADSSIASIQDLRDRLIAALVSGGEIDTNNQADVDAAKSFIENILNSVMGDEAMQAAYDRAALLKEKIYEGLASPEEMAEYDSLIEDIGAKLQAAQSNATWRPAVDALRDLRQQTVTTSKELINMAAAEKAANSNANDLSDEIDKLRDSFDALNDKAAKANGLKEAADILKNSKPDTKEYTKALEYLKDNGYGALLDDLERAIPIIEADAQALAEAANLEKVQLQGQGNIVAAVIAQKLHEAKNAADQKGIETYTTLQAWINNILSLFGQLNVMGVKSDYSTYKPKSSGGGSKNKALDNQIAQLEHYRALDQLTTAEEIANLERILAKYAKTTAEKRKLTEELYALRKQKAQEDLDFRKAMDQLTLREEIEALDSMIATYKDGTAARRELEQQRYEATRALEKQEYDLKVHYGQLTLEEQEATLRQMISTYKEGTDARIELEKELYDVQQSIRERDIDRLNSLIDAVVGALKARYDAQREAEENTLKASIESWKTWGNEQVEAIQRQIKALDELTKAEDDAEIEAAKRRKVAALEQAVMYEQDAYNRRKLQEQLAAAQDDLNKWLRDKEREALKAKLQDEIDAVNKTVETETDKLQAQIDANNAYYDELTKEQNLQAEAQKLLMQNNQAEIIGLLKAFAPEYNATGKTLGEQFIDGFISAVGPVETWFSNLIANLTAPLTAYQQQLAGVANAAAVRFYATQGIPSAAASSPATGAVTRQIILNAYFNEPREYTPSEIRRELERMLEQVSDL